MLRKNLMPAVLFTSLLSLPVLNAEVLRLQNGSNGYSGCQDTYLNGVYDANKLYNYGASTCLNVYGIASGGGKQTGLIRFLNIVGNGANQVPIGANIVSARLKLLAFSRLDLTGSDTVNAYKMLKDWTVGTANGVTQNGSSCYNYRKYRTDGNYSGNPGDTWGGDGVAHTGPVGGYDYNPAMTALCNIKGTTPNQVDTALRWLELDVTAAVKDWQDDQNSNFGLYLYTNGFWPWAYFYSSDNATPVNRPVLEIEYTFSTAEFNFDNIGSDNKTITDISQNNHDCVFNNTVSLSTDIPDALKPLFAPTTGKSVCLTGSQIGTLNNPSTIDLKNNGNNGYTFQCWFKPNVVQASTLIQIKKNNSTTHVLGINSAGYPETKLYNSSGLGWYTATSGSSISANSWYHLAAVYGGSTDGRLWLYVNGAPVSSVYVGQALNSSHDQALIGGGGEYGYANGLIDDALIENTARSASELHYPSTASFDQIVIPATATGAELFAAGELQTWLCKITGTTLTINQSDSWPENRAIIIGAHPANEFYADKLAQTYPISTGSLTTAMNYEAFGICYDGKQIHLVGQSGQALLYSAFDLLETIGVRWIFPTAQGAYVPTQLALAPFEKYDAPKLWNRGPNYTVSSSDTTYPADLRANEDGVLTSSLYTWRMRNNQNTAYDGKDAVVCLGSGHSYDHYLPATQTSYGFGPYGADHHEWYSLIGGVRQVTSPGLAQVCFTNSAAANQFATNVCTEVQAQINQGVPIERIVIYVSPNDGSAWCECNYCQALLSSYEKTNMQAGSLVTNFANLVCAKIRLTFPGANVIFLGYSNYARPGDPGDNVHPGNGVSAMLTAWPGSNSTYFNNAKPGMNATYNPNFYNWIGTWAGTTDAVSAYMYYGHYNWFTPWPMLTQIANDLPTMYANSKFRGMNSENHRHWGTQLPNFWLQSRLMWNPGYDANKIKDDFYNKGFGPAAADIKNYYNCLQASMDSYSYIMGAQEELISVLTSTVINNCNSYIDSAESKLSQMTNDLSMQWRTKHIINGWRNSAKMGNAMLLYTAAYISDQGARNNAKTAIISYLDDVKTFANTEDGKWAFENKTAVPQIEAYKTTLSFPLTAIPAGNNQVFSFSLMWGGAINLFATQLTGFYNGRWGLCLNSGASGELDVPITAASGKTITSAKIQVGLFNSADVYVNNVRLASGLPAAAQELIIPPDQLGTTMTFKVKATNTSGSSQIVITSFKITVDVQ